MEETALSWALKAGMDLDVGGWREGGRSKVT